MAHLTRYYMYKKIKDCLKKNGTFPMCGKILGISGVEHFREFMDEKQVELIPTEYPKVDMQNMPYKNGIFDFVISDQVIEHLEDPMKAVMESCRVLKEGGIAIHTTCFVNYFHPSPNDYWRFSPDALKLLCNNFSGVLCSEGWGNRLAIFLCLLSKRFRFLSIPDSKWSFRRLIADYNELEYPIVTWVVAKK